MIRVSQWAEIRHLVLVQGVPKREVARRMGLDRKTVDRAVASASAPGPRPSPPRGRRLDAHRSRIEGWLREDRRVTAKRIGVLLREATPSLTIQPRALRAYVAEVRAALFPREAFVHRSHPPGRTLEVDFGETRLVVAGREVKAKFLVATLPASNVHFAKVYPVERLECLLDGIYSAFEWMGGLTERLVLDNTSLAVREVHRGAERDETRAFYAFRGELALHADFCAPRKGWEKGSVEGGVRYVRGNCFRPMMRVGSWAEANARILQTLEADLDVRRLGDGRTCREALDQERTRLRSLPLARPSTARVLSRVIDKFGHVGVDGVRYDVPIALAYKPALVRLEHDRLDILVDNRCVMTHARSFERGAYMLDPRNVLPLLALKTRAAGEATALCRLPRVFDDLRDALRTVTRQADREWIRILRLIENHSEEQVEEAIRNALDRGSPRLATIRQILRLDEPAPHAATPLLLTRSDLAQVVVPQPRLAAYDDLVEDIA